MRRIARFIFCLLLGTGVLLAGTGAAAAESDSTLYVSSAQELLEALSPAHSSATIILTADIALGSYQPSVFFSGVLDGQGHTVSFTQSQGCNGFYGLVATLHGDGQITNLHVNASITPGPEESAAYIGLISGAVCDNAAVTNCSVDGTIDVQPSDSGSCIYAGGVTGLLKTSGIISDCDSDVYISIDSAGDAFSGGIAAAVTDENAFITGCSYTGSTSLTELPSGGAYSFVAHGISNANLYNCSFSGSLYCETIAGEGYACGLYDSRSGSSSGIVEAVTRDGNVSAFGANACYCVDSECSVTATATGTGTAQAAGLVKTYMGTNLGNVLASSVSGNASAYGVCDSHDYAVNRADITASTSGGTAYAVGVDGISLTAYECFNYGGITALSVSGKCVAVGLNGVSTGENTGSVTAECEGGSVVAQGLVGCRFSKNSGNVSATYNGSDIGTLSAQGLNTCYVCENRGAVSGIVNTSLTAATVSGSVDGSYNINYASVTATSQSGSASARGVKDISSQNYGTVCANAYGPKLSDDGSASAFGVYEGTGCVNYADVCAYSAQAGALAYGHTGSGNVSTGTAQATATYYETDSSGFSNSSRPRAYNSASAVAVSFAGTASVSGGDRLHIYHIIPRFTCLLGHKESNIILSPDSSQIDECFLCIGEACSDADSDYEVPVLPENTDAENGYYDDGTLRVIMDFCFSSGSVATTYFNSFERACGSLRAAVEGADFGGKFTVRIRAWGDPSTEEHLTLTLPSGFSFAEWSLETTRDVTVVPGDGAPGSASPIEVWPIYIEGSGSTSVTFTLSRGEDAIITKMAAIDTLETEGDIDARPTAGVSAHPSEPIRVNALTDYGVDFTNAFVSGPTSYQQPLGDLTCALSQSIYGSTSGSEQAYIVPAFENLGCSDYQWFSPADEANEVAICFAQKKIIREGSLHNVLFVVIRGTYDWDWIGNFDAFGNSEGHNNFLHAATVARSHVDSYVDEYLPQEARELTRVCLTGHSRAAAVTDILCSWMENDGWNGFYGSKTAYTFAAPSAFTSEQPADVDVTNIVFIHDIVGFVPMQMYKYGTTYVIGSLDSSEAPESVKSLFARYSGAAYNMPDNSILIAGLGALTDLCTRYPSLVSSNGTAVRNGFLHPDVVADPYGDSLGTFAKHFLECSLNRKMKSLTGTSMTEYIRKHGMNVDSFPIIPLMVGTYCALPNRKGADQVAQEWLDSLVTDGAFIGYAHGSENYMAWVHGNSISSCRTYEQAREDQTKNGITKMVEPVLKFSDAVKSALTDNLNRGIELIEKKAGEAVSAARAARDQLAGAVSAAVDEAERIALEKSLELAEAALDQASRKLDSTQRMLNQLGQLLPSWDFGFVQPIFYSPSLGTSTDGATFIWLTSPADITLQGDDGASDIVFANHELSDISWDHYGEAVGDGYLLFVQNNEAADLTITGTEDGIMDVVVFTLGSSLNLSTVESYVGIPVTAGETFSMHLQAGTTRGQRLVSSLGTAYAPDAVSDLTLLCVDAAPETAEPGDTLTFSASALGGEGELTYSFTLLRNGEAVGEPVVTQASTCDFTPAEYGIYKASVTVSDAAGHSDGPMESRDILVWADPSGGSWSWGVGLNESVMGADGPWMGSLYNIWYDGTWLSSWEDYDVSVVTDHPKATVEAVLLDGWTDGVNFYLYGLYEDCTLNLFITVHKRETDDEGCEDLVLHESIHVISAENAIAPTLAGEADTSAIVARVSESGCFPCPQLNEDGTPPNGWWVSIESEDPGICSVWVQGEELYYYPANPGTTTLNIVARSYDASIVLVSRTITVLGEDGDRCGADAFWQFDSDGVLTISGTGAIDSYGYDSGQNTYTAPWYGLRESITSLVVEEGITELGAFMMANCSSLTSVSLPSGLETIGPYTFALCGSLRQITLPAAVSSVQTGAFLNTPLEQVYYGGTESRRGSMSIDNSNEENQPLLDAAWICVDSGDGTLFLPSDLSVIRAEAFCGAGMQAVVVPDSCRRIESRAFADCPALTLVWLPAGLSDIAEDAFEGSPVTLLRR